jgi:DNA-binding response OmpR family regulator
MSATRKRILLVEDEYLVGVLIGDMLADLGYELGAAADRFEDALKLATDGLFDMALLDLTLRNVATYPIAAVLRQRGMPFAFVTGRLAVDIDGRYADIPTLQKPFRLNELADLIARLIP